MYMLLRQTLRNLKIFLKDRANVFFSLMAPLIVLALYILFLGRLQSDGLLEVLQKAGFSGAETEKAVQAFCDAWMLAGCLACACITVPLCACGVIVQDRKRGITSDLLASPVPAWMPPAAYFLSVFAAGLCLSLIVLAVSFLWLAASGSWFLSAADVFGCIGNVFLSVLSSSALLSVVIRFVRTEGAFTGVNIIFGTVIGFLIGAYMPISLFPDGVQKFTLFIPGSYSAGLFRNLIMGGTLDEISRVTSGLVVSALEREYSFSFDFFGLEIGMGGMAAVLAISAVIFLSVCLLLNILEIRAGGRKEKKGGAVSR